MPPKGSKWSKERYDRVLASLKREKKVRDPHALATALALGKVRGPK
jgi:hypothetical protein